MHLIDVFAIFGACPRGGGACPRDMGKWPKMASLTVVFGHPGTPRAHTWWLERSATLLTRSGWLLHLMYVFAIFGVLSTCPRGCLREKVEKIEKKWIFVVVAFFDQKHVETSRNGIKSVQK